MCSLNSGFVEAYVAERGNDRGGRLLQQDCIRVEDEGGALLFRGCEIDTMYATKVKNLIQSSPNPKNIFVRFKVVHQLAHGF